MKFYKAITTMVSLDHLGMNAAIHSWCIDMGNITHPKDADNNYDFVIRLLHSRPLHNPVALLESVEDAVKVGKSKSGQASMISIAKSAIP